MLLVLSLFRSKHKFTKLEDILHYRFQNRQLLSTAFTHRSVNSNPKENYERLEYLGDAVLDMIVSDLVIKEFPEGNEGLLTKKRSALVQQSFLSQMGKTLKLLGYISIDSTVDITKKKVAAKQEANLFESLIGGLFLDGGVKPCARLIKNTIWAYRLEAWKSLNYKGLLIEYCHSNGNKPPVFQVANITGPEHEKLYEVHVSIDNQTYPSGFESNKKAAEQAAAELALNILQN